MRKLIIKNQKKGQSHPWGTVTCSNGFRVARWGALDSYEDKHLEKEFFKSQKSEADKYRDELNAKDGVISERGTINYGKATESTSLIFVKGDRSIEAKEKAIEEVASKVGNCYVMSVRFVVKNEDGSFWLVKYLSFD